MKLKYNFLAGAVIASAITISTWAQPEPAKPPVGAEKKINDFTQIQIKNLQGESLGRMMDLGIDLINGRIVEVLVTSDSSLGVGNKIVAVPPLALIPDQLNEVYQLNVSTEVFKTAAAIDLSQWLDAGRSDRVAAAYRLFGQEPYFLEEGATASKTAERPKVLLGYVERSSKITNLLVRNLQNERLGKVWSLTLDVPKGRIVNVIVLAPGNLQTKSIIPAMVLSFNAKRDALLIDETKEEFADEPRYILKEAAFGNEASYTRESLHGAHTSAALEQGSSYRDMDRTVLITKNIRAARINGRNVEVGTINDRVTLRGWVNTEEDKRRIGEIAIAASTVMENVDNQITVGRPGAKN
jgi:sporulation protein YlmC with PRC-barrel domain